MVNISTGKLEERPIVKRSEKPSEQYWERKPLPDWYKGKMREEDNYNKRRSKNQDLPPYFDEQYFQYVSAEKI